MAKVSTVVGLKVAFVEGFVNDWAVYLGKAEWDDEEVTHNGLNPNPPKDTDGRREDSGRGWVRELQGRWPGVLG